MPLVTVLFMAAYMLPLFLPDGVTINKLLSALIAVALFSSAYMAEVVRGGLQAIPKGQYEAAAAMGLGYWQSMAFIILPQALRLAIPNIVGNFIGLLEGHDAGFDHRLLRSARHHPGGHGATRLGDAEHGAHRLCLRRRGVLGHVFRHVALCQAHGRRVGAGERR